MTQIASDLLLCCAVILSSEQTTCSSLGLVTKSDGSFRRIHNLFFSYSQQDRDLSVNNAIPDEYLALTYSTIDEIIALILLAGRGFIIIKRDIKTTFRHIPVTL